MSDGKPVPRDNDKTRLDKTKWPRHRHALTLVELLAVLSIMSILAAGVSVSLRGPYASLRLREAVEQLRAVDRMTRDHARRFGRGATLTLSGSSGLSVSSEGHRERRFTLPPAVRVATVVLPGRRFGDGSGEVAFSGNGTSVSYGVCIQLREQEQWLLVAGLTGQVTEMADEEDIRDLFRHVETVRTDSD